MRHPILSLVVLSCVSLSCVCGCASGLMNFPADGMFSRLTDPSGSRAAAKKKADADDNDFGNRIETPLLSNYISVNGNNLVVLRGVGLVTGLDGTGDNPPPSSLRTALRDEMSRRGIKQPEQILASRNTALVVVTAYLPAMVREGQRFDVRVAIPPNSQASSLKGGWLLETRLFEEQTIEGRGTLKGREYGVAFGAILTALGVDVNRGEISAEMRRGSIPGGAISKTDRDLSIVLRTDKRGFRNSKRIADAVSERFHHYNRYGQRIALAEAKRDDMLTLKMHPTYRNNFPRYQQVIRNIAFKETDVSRRMRLESLEREIGDPATAQQAALQLEAIGEGSIPFLKRALGSSDFEVQFHSAQALAYLGDPSGIEVLKQAVAEQPALRVYSLAALSVIDDADAIVALRDLMNAPELETRYGAFRALKELDPNDSALRPSEYANRFTLYSIESTGQPMIHVTRRRTPEVVLFGTDQLVHLPLMLKAGRNILIQGEGGGYSVTVTKYELNQEEPIRTTVPCRLADIIRTCGDLGATYPDIVQMLIEAEQQKNLSGDFGIDRMPQAGRMLVRDSTGAMKEDDAATKRIGNAVQIPNLFDKLEDDELRKQESDEKLNALNFEVATDPKTSTDTSASDDPSADESSSGGTTSDGTPVNSSATDSSASKRVTADRSAENESTGDFTSDRTTGDSVSADRKSLAENSAEAEKESIEEMDRGDLPGLSEGDESSTKPSTGPSPMGGETPGPEEVDLSRMKPGLGARVRGLFSNPFSKP